MSASNTSLERDDDELDYQPPILPTDDESAQDAMADSDEIIEPDAPRLSVRRRRRLAIDMPVLVLIVGLIGAAALLYGTARGTLPPGVAVWWPLAVCVVGGFGLLLSLVRGRAAGLLGAAGILGIGIALLLATAYQVALGSSLVGVTFITLGTAIVLRGLLFRPAAR